MIKKILVNLSLLCTLIVSAQQGTSSPYSFYGIGDVKFKGTIDARSMGGVSVFKDSIHLNLQNPASYANLKLSTLGIAGTYSKTDLKTETASESSKRVFLDYLAVGLPLGKFGASFGLMPYSSVGYNIQSLNTGDGESNSQFTGSGGLNKVFTGIGYMINKNLSVGADVNYNFGKINTKSIEYVNNVQYGTREVDNSTLSGFGFNTGLMYNRKINEKHLFYGSLIYTPESKLTVTNDRVISIIQFSSSGSEVVIDKVEQDVPNSKIILPSKVTLGVGYGEEKKWGIGTELTFQQNSNLSNRFNDIDNVTFENSTKYSLGGFFIPNYNAYSNYFNRITYRAGMRYENTGLVIQNKAIDDIGITFGLGLPSTNSLSNLNIGLEIGKRGTIYSGLVQENYINLSFSLSLNDRWFIKRKYD